MEKYIVYKHTCPNEKVYIGITCKTMEYRSRKDGSGYARNKYFWNAIQKYGWDNFTHEVLYEGLTKEEACQKEIELIEFYKSNQREYGYNHSTGGESNKDFTFTHTIEARQKISVAGKGKKRSEETCKRISEGRKGIHHSMTPEGRKRISESNKTRIVSVETRQKLSKLAKGRKLSDTQKQKLIELRCKKILCITTNEVFNSIKEAAEKLNLPYAQVKGNAKANTNGHDCVTKQNYKFIHIKENKNED